MAINTLYDYYKSKGQNLPTLVDRSKTFEQLGLGAAQSYQGTYSQNVALLNKLQTQPESKPAASPTERLEAAPLPYIKYQNSPDVYERATGRYIPYTEAKEKNIWPQIEQLNAVRPADTKTSNQQLPSTQTVGDKTVPTNVGLFQQYQTDINQRLQELEEREKKVLAAEQNLPKKADLLTTARQEQGLTEDIKRAESLDERLANLEGSLYESESDIRNRIKQSGGIVTESQVQRLVAAEKTPLIEEYNRLSAERQRLDQRISSKESLAQTYTETQFEDLSRALGIAQTELEFGQKRYEIYSAIAKDMLNASQTDVAQIISMAQSENEAERQAAEDEIDLAFKMADLAIKTPAGTTFEIGGQKISGLKTSSGSSSTPSTLSPTQFNIRAGLAGLTKDQANDLVTKDYPPDWFRVQEETNAQASLTPAELQRRWNELKGKVQTEAQTQSSQAEEDPFEAIIKKALGITD